MIEIRDVSIHFGTQEVLEHVSLQVNRGERVGIVGPNGAGKSTLFGLVTGELLPYRGDVSVASGCRTGYVRQQLPVCDVHESLVDFVCAGAGDLAEMERVMADLSHRLAEADEVAQRALLRELGEVQSSFEHRAGYSLMARAEVALCGLGFDPNALRQPIGTFSGGWRMRAELARALIADPDLLLLDEPSNYLDMPAIEWLQKCLRDFKGTLLLISHDRFLLRSLTTLTVEVCGLAVTRYAGGYDFYTVERERRYRQQLAASQNQDRKREQLERFIERFRAKNTLATQAQSRIKQLAKMEKIEVIRPVQTRGRIRLRTPPHCGVEIVRLDSAGLTYDSQRWVLRGLDLTISRGEKVALVGYNGLGKTTLLRMIAGALPLSEGRRVLGHKVVVGYQSQDFAETMDPDRTVFETVRSVAGDLTEQQVRTQLGGFGFSGDAIEKRVNVLSGGEKIRLAFARLLVQPVNLLILDEPTTHLDIQACEALEEALLLYTGTLCLVSHDIDFVRKVATGIIAMTPPGVTRYPGGYDYYHEKMTSDQSSVSGGRNPDAKGQREGVKRTTDIGPQTKDKVDKKELRQQRAAERQALYDQTKDLKKDVRRAEQQVAALEPERAKVLEQLANPAQVKDFMALNRKLLHIEEEIKRFTELWEKSALALEKIEGRAKDE
jgi:ATP-binding cassette subfamily F protein 3